MKGIPFYGKGDFNWVASQSNFSNGISIKMLPLSDLSRPQVVNLDQFDAEIKEMNQMFKKGTRIGGIKVNSTFQNEDRNPETIIGKFDSFKIDRKNKNIRAYILDELSNKLVEVYPQTLSRLNESLTQTKTNRAKTFLEFLI